MLRLIALGHTNAEIAAQLYLSVRTIESHRQHIHHKIHRTNRAELVHYAREHGLLELHHYARAVPVDCRTAGSPMTVDLGRVAGTLRQLTTRRIPEQGRL